MAAMATRVATAGSGADEEATRGATVEDPAGEVEMLARVITGLATRVAVVARARTGTREVMDARTGKEKVSGWRSDILCSQDAH